MLIGTGVRLRDLASGFLCLDIIWQMPFIVSGFQSQILYAHLAPPRLFIVTAAAAATAYEYQNDQYQHHTNEDEEDCKWGNVPVRLKELLRLQSGEHVDELILNHVSLLSLWTSGCVYTCSTDKLWLVRCEPLFIESQLDTWRCYTIKYHFMWSMNPLFNLLRSTWRATVQKTKMIAPL